MIKELRPSAAESYLQDKDEVLVAGRVYQKADKEKYQIIYLENNSIKYRQQSLRESRLIIYDEHKENVRIGDTLTVHGKIRFFENARNPGNFDSKLYYQKQDIHANVWAESVQIREGKACTLIEKLENELYQFRQEWKSKLCEQMGEQDGVLSWRGYLQPGDLMGPFGQYQSAGSAGGSAGSGPALGRSL